MKKIAIIVCFMGEFPWYYKYFIHSCKFNPSIDFLIFSDNITNTCRLSSNIFTEYMTLEGFNNLASSQLGVKISLENAYKICDFRPAFGIIFSKYLEHKYYDFWGHADIDVIFGDIRSFLTQEILEENEIISVRPEYVTGFFALYKNKKDINQLYVRSKDYETVFQSSEYMGFDECSLLCTPLAYGENLSNLKANIESITHIVSRLTNEKQINSYFDLHVIEGTPGDLEWSNGILIYKNRFEILLFHLISFKGHPLLQIPIWESIPDTFIINENSFSSAIC